jgi:hypothetical protein
MPEIIASLWIGTLSKYEILAIKSWLYNGYEFHLYTYSTVANIPSGVIVCDANQILPEFLVAQYQSIANFADLFRYKMIYDTGKIWTDIDVFCLNQIDLSPDYIFITERTIKQGAFKSNDPEKLVISFMKGVKNSDFMNSLFKKALQKINFILHSNSNSGLSADKHPAGRILVKKEIDLWFNLEQQQEYIKPYYFAFPVDWWDFKKCFQHINEYKASRGWTNEIDIDDIIQSGQLLCIHNGWVKHNKIDKENPVEGSLYKKLCNKFDI